MPHFEKLMKRSISLLGSDLFLHAWNDKKLFSRLTGFDTFVSNFEFIETEAWFDMDWFQEVMQSNWDDKPEVFFHFSHKGEVAGEALIHYCRQIDLAIKNREEFEEWFWRSAKLLQNLSVFIPITHPISMLIEKKVRAILSGHGVPERDLDEQVLTVSAPDKRNGPEQELIDLRRIHHQMRHPGFDTEAALAAHWKKFAYLGYRDLFSSGYSLEFFRDRLMTGNLDEMGIPHRDLATDGFSSDELEMIRLLKEFVWFRNYRTEKFFEGFYLLEPLWKALSRAYQLEEHDLFYYLVGDVSALFIHDTHLPDAELASRRAGTALLLEDNQFLLLTGELLKKKEADIREESDPDAKEINGMVVCRGVCSGPVVIVHNDGELDKVKEGDILVTGMTTPDYLPALQKAAAFVTDEGGITCHAAIVAREMKKPCIVGTKRATEVLKEGQKVEVDANAGTVRIL